MTTKRIALSLLLLLGIVPVVAQRVETVRGEYSYHVPENVSLDRAKTIAVERARLKAIADTFGTEISQTNISTISSKNNQSENTFQSLGSSEVKGDWLEDIDTPEIAIRYESSMLVVTAKVHGKVRERMNTDLDLQIKVLCNGIESSNFKDRDQLAVDFKTPVKGYLSIYLLDDNTSTAFCLLPYENEDGKMRILKHNVNYTLLPPQDRIYPSDKKATILTTTKDLEHNRLIFIFSTNEFNMPLTNAGKYLPELSLKDFNKWLHRNKVKDSHLQVVERVVEIRKR